MDCFRAFMPLKALAVVGVVAALLVRPALALETEAREAILVDAQSGRVLFEKNADELMPPSSMTKVMTLYLVFERLADGRLTMEDTLPVSERAWRKGGSKMFVEVGDRVSIENLLRGIIIQSGNDACIVVAEGLSGTEDAFAREMTKRGREIGLTSSTFKNSTGWPDPEHRMTARDLNLLALRTILDFPQYYHYFAETDFTWSDITQSNRNPLLYKNMGADGLKTGHTQEAGYGLTASAIRDGRRLVLVVNGLPSERARSEESERLIEWGFREFSNYELFSAGQEVDRAEVWLGAEESVPLTLSEPVLATLSQREHEEMTVSVLYDAPIPAPIAEGQELAVLRITAPGMEPMEYPLYAATNVEKVGPFGRMFEITKHFIMSAF